MSKKVDRRTFIKDSTLAGLGVASIGSFAHIEKAFAYAQTASPDPKFIGKKRVVVFGGGVAGLTAAHELLERGFNVTLYESRSAFGGKARSIYVPGTGTEGRQDLPGEHGFRMFPGGYNNLPHTMARIPYGRNARGVYDNLVSAESVTISRKNKIDLTIPAVAPWELRKKTLSQVLTVLGDQFGCKPGEIKYFINRLHVYATSCGARRFGEFENIAWWDFIRANEHSKEYQTFLGIGMTRSLQALKAEETSARTVGWYTLLFLMMFMGMTKNIDQVLIGPTSEMWIEPWLNYLKQLGLKYYSNAKLLSLHTGNNQLLEGARVEREGKQYDIDADFYVNALPLDVMNHQIIPGSSDLKDVQDIQNLKQLGFDNMNGIQFFLDRPIDLPKGHILFLDSPWSLTCVSHAPFWKKTVSTQYGDGRCQAILSVDISCWDIPGALYGKPANQCTPKEIECEVMSQILATLDEPSRQSIVSAKVLKVFIDSGVRFSENGIGKYESNDDPLFINKVGTWKLRPQTQSSIENLFYACGYTQTAYDIDCMETANESGRRAARKICELSGVTKNPVQVFGHSEPAIFAVAKARDYFRYKSGQKNIHDQG